MNKVNQKLYVTLIVAALLAAAFAQMSTGQTAEVPDINKVLVFLKDVVKLDMSNYNATLVLGPFLTNRSELGGLTETNGKYALTYGTSKLDVLFVFTNDILSWCLVTIMDGSPKYSEPLAANFSDVAKDFIQRYDAFTKDPNLSVDQSLLNDVDFSKNSSTAIGNLKIEITVRSFSSSLYVSNTFNGAVYNGFGVTFENEDFRAFSDDRSYYKMGDPTVNISHQQAVDIALKRVETFSYSYGGKQISNFGIVKDHIAADLLTQSRYKPLELYPYWRVSLPLDNLYPGSVNSIEVTLWADTGEVIETHVLELGGGFPSEEQTPTPIATTEPTPAASSISPSLSPNPPTSPSPSSTSPASPSPTMQPSEPPPSTQQTDRNALATTIFLISAAAVAIAIAAAVTALLIRKKTK